MYIIFNSKYLQTSSVMIRIYWSSPPINIDLDIYVDLDPDLKLDNVKWIEFRHMTRSTDQFI